MNANKRRKIREKQIAWKESRVVVIRVHEVSRIHDSVRIDLTVSEMRKAQALTSEEQQKMHGLLSLMIQKDGQTWSGEVEIDRRNQTMRITKSDLREYYAPPAEAKE